MKRNKHFRAGLDAREFNLIKALVKEMYGEYSDVHEKEIMNADELHIHIDNSL